jgi:hypothetical protein
MLPLLLRSAGVLAFVAVMAGVVSNSALLDVPEPEPLPEAALVAQPDSTGAAMLGEIAPRIESASAEPPDPAAVEMEAMEPFPDAPPAGAAASLDPTADPGPVVEPTPVALPAPAAPASDSPEIMPLARELVAPLDPGNQPAPKAVADPPAPAEDCPRDWLTTGREPGAPCPDATSPLVETAALPDGALSPEDIAGTVPPELMDADAARIPKARPEPPRIRVKKTARVRASWPADDPPKCGKKRAKWRYVNDVPTWYCK